MAPTRPRPWAGVTVLLTGLLAGPAGVASGQTIEVEPPPSVVEWTEARPADWPAPPPASARAYVLVDALTGQVLAERAADEPRVVASTVKLLTVLTALETLEVDDEVVVDEAAAVGGAGASVDPGERWRVGDLLDAILVRSGNDAAIALAAAATDGDLEAFVDRMNVVADQLGVSDDAVITDPTGLEDSNRLSAADLALLGRAALADERVASSARQADVALPDGGPTENRNLLVDEYEGATGLKTGFTTEAGYCLVASAERDGRELVAVVLGSREDPARFEETASLLDLAYEDLRAADHAPLRARLPGGWQSLLPAGRVWAPPEQAPAVDLGGTADRPELLLAAGEQVLGEAEAAVEPVEPSGVGAHLADALYRTMRHAHVADAWPVGDGGAGTPAGDSG